MRRTIAKADVRNEIYTREYYEPLVAKVRKIELVHPRAWRAASSRRAIEFAAPTTNSRSRQRFRRDAVWRAICTPITDVKPIALPRATPRRPAPQREQTRERIRRNLRRLRNGVSCTEDTHHARVIAISREHFCAKRQKRCRRNAVIFQHDTAFFLREKPVERTRYCGPTTLIRLKKARFDAAFPRRLCKKSPHFIDARRLV